MELIEVGDLTTRKKKMMEAKIYSLYQWLIEKGYTEAEAEETVVRYNNGMEIPDNIKRDIKEFTEVFIQRFSK